MAQKNKVFAQKLSQKGYFNFKDLYSFCFEYLSDGGYSVSEGEYSESVGGDGKEIKVKWDAKKKVTDYLKNTMSIEFSVKGMKDVEVEQDGKKVSTNKGSITVKVEANMERDYEDTWEKHQFWKFMRGIYDKYIVNTTIDEYEGRLSGAAKGFVAEVKSFLQLSS